MYFIARLTRDYKFKGREIVCFDQVSEQRCIGVNNMHVKVPIEGKASSGMLPLFATRI